MNHMLPAGAAVFVLRPEAAGVAGTMSEAQKHVYKGRDPTTVWGLYCCILQLFRSHPFTDGTRGVSSTFQDQHVFSSNVKIDRGLALTSLQQWP